MTTIRMKRFRLPLDVVLSKPAPSRIKTRESETEHEHQHGRDQCGSEVGMSGLLNSAAGVAEQD